MAAAQRGDFATAFQEWLPLAEQDDAKAQGAIGALYDNGMGVPENDAEAAKWFRKAAEQGEGGAKKRLENLQAK